MDQEVALLPTQDLTIIPTDIRLSVFTTPGAIEPWLDHVRKSVADFKPDTSTARGRANIKSIAFEVTKSKTYLTKVGKELADAQKAIPKLIDATRKHVTDTLEALATEVRKPLTDWEEADEARVETHRKIIEGLTAASQNCSDSSAEQLRGLLGIVEACAIDEENCEEFLSEYQRARDASVLILKALIPIRETAEADRAELIQLRAAATARDERDRFEADLLEKAAAETARANEAAARKVEDDRLAAEAKAENERRQADYAAQLVIETEQRVLREAEEAKAAEAAETLRRERDVEHRRAVNKAAVTALIDAGLYADVATKVVELIVKKAIPAVTITY